MRECYSINQLPILGKGWKGKKIPNFLRTPYVQAPESFWISDQSIICLRENKRIIYRGPLFWLDRRPPDTSKWTHEAIIGYFLTDLSVTYRWLVLIDTLLLNSRKTFCQTINENLGTKLHYLQTFDRWQMQRDLNDENTFYFSWVRINIIPNRVWI